MAEEQQPYQLITSNGENLKSSLDFTGRGTATYPNGDIYEGDFVNGVREGQGSYTFVNQDKYVGQWKNNMKHGIGKMTYNSKDSYFGNYEMGKREGEGLFSYKNKDLYSGNWLGGKKQGKGTYVYFDTKAKFTGDWVDGKFSHGKWILSDGSYFQGQFKYDKPVGVGTWVLANKDQVNGTYVQNIINDHEGKSKIELEWITSN